MEAPYRCVGSEPSDLALPVAEQGRGADDERRAGGVGGPLAVQMQRDEGDGLAEAHVIGQAAAETEGRHAGEPAEATELVIAESGLQTGWRLDRVVGAVWVGDAGAEVVEPLGRRDRDLPAVDLGG